jgi:AcrR family transcriptional regulator
VSAPAAAQPSAPTRRERQRQATFEEIVAVARRLLRAGEDVSLRAVASEMGMTAPALYRYVDSHAELMTLIAHSVFDDVIATMAAARDEHPDDDPAAQTVAATWAFRSWALANRAEFQLIFATPPTPEWIELCEATAAVPMSALADCVPSETGMQQFGEFFAEIFGRLWARYRFPIPADDELDPVVLDVLRVQAAHKLEHGSDSTEGPGALGPPSAGMVWMFERAWARLYGTVTLEVFGHLHPGFVRTGALFAATMRDIGRDLGLEQEWERLGDLARG